MALTINTNIPGLYANRQLGLHHAGFSSALQKLSSGLKVNQAADNPAALVISELLRSQLGGLQRSIQNTQEANNVLSIAEGGLSEVSDQLRSMRELAIQALNSGVTSKDQVSADQAQMNANLGTISRIANSTSYSDQNLLNGAKGITFAANDAGNILNLGATQINQVPDIAGQKVAVQFAGGAANQAEKAYLQTNLGGGTTLASNQQFTVTGVQGTMQFQFSAGTSVSDMAATINQRAGNTGVSAYSINGDTELRLVSQDYGADQTVRVQQTVGNAFAAAGATAQDAGQNATLQVNGQQAQTEGLKLQAEEGGFSAILAFQEGKPAATTIAQTGYDQTALTNAATAQTATLGNFQGGMRLQLGETAGSQSRGVFGINSMDPANLGRVSVGGRSYSMADLQSGGGASLANNPEVAIKVIDQAIADVAGQRGRIGAYQANTLQTNASALSVALENVTATESGIRDTDMAEEVTNYIREQLLEKTALMGVQSSNINAQNVMKLLGG
jgi:flagellin